MRDSMLSLSHRHESTPFLCQTSSTHLPNSWMLLGGSGYSSSRHFTIPQRCSIGFKSGDWDGHFIVFIFSLAGKFFVELDEYLESLCYWKKTPPLTLKGSLFTTSSIVGIKKVLRMLINCPESILPAIRLIPPVPNQDMQPQIIKLPPPNLRVSSTISGE